MAITMYDPEPGFGTLIGTGLGTGIGKSLEAIAQQKLDQFQKKNMLSSLVDANVPENVANAIVSAPKSLQREMFKPLLKINKALGKEGLDKPQPIGKQGSLRNLYNLRKKILKNVKTGQMKPDVMKDELSRRGVAPEEINVLLGSELNDDIVRYFLDKTNNDPKKARKLAKKFGYKV